MAGGRRGMLRKRRAIPPASDQEQSRPGWKPDRAGTGTVPPNRYMRFRSATFAASPARPGNSPDVRSVHRRRSAPASGMRGRPRRRFLATVDRKSVVEGKGVAVVVELGGG